jgi:hypothetical protein
VNTEAKTCPNCGSTKPFKNQNLTQAQIKGMSFSEMSQYKKLGGKIEMGKGQKIFWGVLVIIIAIAILIPSTPKAPQQVEVNTQQQADAPIEKSVPTEYISALAKAEMYSSTMHMSKKGLYEQLTSDAGEKFSADAAQYAIKNINADYKNNALKKAEMYQETMHMSPASIRDQLVSDAGEKFTKEEAKYALENLK